MKNIPAKRKSAKLIPLRKIVPASIFKLGRKSKAAVIVDRKGVPQVFLFDSFALLDLLSKIDEGLVDRLSSEAYHDPSVNLAGWLIDAIEAKLPVHPDFVHSLQKAIAEAKRKGWIPFEDIKQELDAA